VSQFVLHSKVIHKASGKSDPYAQLGKLYEKVTGITPTPRKPNKRVKSPSSPDNNAQHVIEATAAAAAAALPVMMITGQDQDHADEEEEGSSLV